jgi:hypothetical protein
MDNHDFKGSLINTYLNQQLSETQESNALQRIELPDEAILDEFKNHVRVWIEIDNMIRKLRGAIKERADVKKNLTEKILRFMAKYNIEDLNTKDGSKLRYHVTKTKAQPSKSQIKERLTQYYGNVSNIDELTEKLFEKNEKTDAVSLRRLNLPKTP